MDFVPNILQALDRVLKFRINIHSPEDIFLLILMIISGLLVGALVGFVFWGLYRLICIGVRISAELERKGSVIGKKFIQSSVTYMPITISNGKSNTVSLIPQFQAAQYLVFLEVDGYEESVVDSEELFRSVQKGDKLSVILVEKNEYRRWNPSKITKHYHEVTSVKLSTNHEIFV